MSLSIIAAVFVTVTILVLVVGRHANVTRSREGKILAFVALFLLPVAAMSIGFSDHMTIAQSTRFCTSCHVMESHGRSLYIDDPSFVAARHFTACVPSAFR